MYRLTRPLVALLLCCFMHTLPAVADGMKFPQAHIKKLPAIPMQRAIIAFRDGQEQLIIESSLEGEGDEFAWIIPVPATPTEFKEVSPGLIKTLSQRLQPEVVNTDAYRLTLHVAVVLALGVLVWASFVLIVMPRSRIIEAIALLAVPLALLLSLYFLKPSPPRTGDLPMSAGISVPGVHVEQSLQMETRDLAVLDADTPEALNTWLNGNGFMVVPETGTQIVQDYINKGWRFVSTKIHTGGTGVNKPKPLSMTFPTSAPIYPMRLTALAGSDVYLELFIVAERVAKNNRLPLEIADLYKLDTKDSLFYLDGVADPQDTPVMSGTRYRQDVAHPAAFDIMWDGCMLTKLAGTLTSLQMDQDLAIKFGSHRPRRSGRYSEYSAQALSASCGLCLWSLGVPLALLSLYRRLNSGRWPRAKVAGTLLLVAVLANATHFIVDSRLLRAEDLEELQILGFDSVRIFEPIIENAVHAYGFGKGWNEDEIARTLRWEFLFDCYHREMGMRMALAVNSEDSPGNYTVKRNGDELILTWYRYDGSPANYSYPLRASDGLPLPRFLDSRHSPSEVAQSLAAMLTPKYSHTQVNELLALRWTYPELAAAHCLKQLQASLASNEFDILTRVTDVRLLAQVTDVRVPAGLHDTAGLERFLNEVRAWCDAHPPEDS